MTLKTNCLYKTSENKVTKQDYLFVILASIISACGFALNSETVVIGSMLISPVLKPLINLAISLLRGQYSTLYLSLLHLLAMIVLVIVIGGCLAYLFYTVFPTLRTTFNNALSEEANSDASAQAKTILGRVGSLIQTDKGLPTTEFWFILLIAIAGGILLARTHCTDEADITTAIIGTGISTSVLPPIIAGAMLFAMGSEHSIQKFGNGLSLSMINVFAIFASYMATLYLSY
jgi:uncharacterized membrane protein